MDSNPDPSKCNNRKKCEAPALTTTPPRFELGNSSSSSSQRIVKRAKFQVTSVTRLVTSSIRTMKEGGKTLAAQTSFVRDAGRIWNRAPSQIKEAATLAEAKREIKS